MGLLSLFESKNKKKLRALELENKVQKKRIRQLERLCQEKDSFFMELMSDGLRHGSPLAGKHMADCKKYKRGK